MKQALSQFLYQSVCPPVTVANMFLFAFYAKPKIQFTMKPFLSVLYRQKKGYRLLGTQSYISFRKRMVTVQNLLYCGYE